MIPKIIIIALLTYLIYPIYKEPFDSFDDEDLSDLSDDEEQNTIKREIKRSRPIKKLVRRSNLKVK